MAQMLSKPALRPYLAEDAPRLAAIFRASIEGLGAQDYSADQIAAWTAMADHEKAFARGLADNLTLVAILNGSPVGFATLKGKDQLHMLYVHPAGARLGVGNLLVDALERLALARGAAKLTSDVSDTALPLFEKRGYTQQRRNTVPVGDVWLGNTTMSKKLGSPDAPP